MTVTKTENGKRTHAISLQYVLEAAVIGGIYSALTLLLAPISYGLVQVRISEALTLLPRFSRASIPGLFIGCFLANLLGTGNMMDIVAGSLATLVAAFCSRKFKDKPWLVPLPPVLINAVVIGLVLFYGYGVAPEAAGKFALLADMAFVGIGQLVACYVLGMPLMKLLERHKQIFA
ncbi:MAG: QueT transporter family protein [Clostridiales Family XIII bacterium]|jgi:uncharacterized membrane protein|nr:QueT transporter family protein [Clostridiales Family XIII bacterium]